MFNNLEGLWQTNSNWESRLWNIIMSTPPLNISNAKNKVGSKVGQKYCVQRTLSTHPHAYSTLLSPVSMEQKSSEVSQKHTWKQAIKKEGKECFEFSSWSAGWGEEGSREFRKVVSLLKNSKQSSQHTKCRPFCECSALQMQYSKQGTIQSVPS